ncbi:MAG: hypothetical protein OZ921_15645 [Sorangiineae bacterium]|nr:hypothetical protein [Polyangiaceae bacterium]MEB2323945.1 hypothetical protein [Sorangiineae bacterium]
MRGLGSVRRGAALAGSALALAVACQADEERPPLVAACTGDAWTQGCGAPGQPTGTPDGGATDAGPDDAPASDGSVTLSGSVRGIQAPDFVTTVAYGGTALIRAARADGAPGQALYDGSAFSFPDAAVSTALWVLAEPQAGGPGAPYLPTLVPIDTTRPGAVTLLLVAGEVLDQIYASVTMPPVRSASAAQLVLALVDAGGRPASGRVVSSPAATDAAIFSAQGTWTDATDATDEVALVIFPNVSAGTLPVSIDGRERATLETRAGAVTFATVQLR